MNTAGAAHVTAGTQCRSHSGWDKEEIEVREGIYEDEKSLPKLEFGQDAELSSPTSGKCQGICNGLFEIWCLRYCSSSRVAGWVGGRFPGYRMASSVCSLLPDLQVELGNVSLCLLVYTASLLFCFTLACSFSLFFSFPFGVSGLKVFPRRTEVGRAAAEEACQMLYIG